MKAYYIEEVLQTSKVLIIPFISILIFGTSNLRSLDSKRVNGNLNQEVFNERYHFWAQKVIPFEKALLLKLFIFQKKSLLDCFWKLIPFGLKSNKFSKQTPFEKNHFWKDLLFKPDSLFQKESCLGQRKIILS